MPGNSTLNQLERILSLTGKPRKDDINSLNSEVAQPMIDSITNVKYKPIREWFKVDVPSDAIDLLSRMLQFNPTKRITIAEALKHPYLTQFHNPKEETLSKKVIHPPVSDNKKLNLKQYKQLIYDRIKKIYAENETPTTSDYKKTASSIHRATDVLREKHTEHRHSMNSHKNSSGKLSSSQSKYHHPPSPAHSSNMTYSIFD